METGKKPELCTGRYVDRIMNLKNRTHLFRTHPETRASYGRLGVVMFDGDTLVVSSKVGYG